MKARSEFESDREHEAYLRDYFAGKIAAAIIAHGGGSYPEQYTKKALRSYAFADAMVSARKGEQL